MYNLDTVGWELGENKDAAGWKLGENKMIV